MLLWCSGHTTTAASEMQENIHWPILFELLHSFLFWEALLCHSRSRSARHDGASALCHDEYYRPFYLQYRMCGVLRLFRRVRSDETPLYTNSLFDGPNYWERSGSGSNNWPKYVSDKA